MVYHPNEFETAVTLGQNEPLYCNVPDSLSESLARARLPGTMATADCTTSTHDEGDCCEEGLHSLSCSEDEDRGELVCTGLIFIAIKAHCCFSM